MMMLRRLLGTRKVGRGRLCEYHFSPVRAVLVVCGRMSADRRLCQQADANIQPLHNLHAVLPNAAILPLRLSFPV